MPYIGHQSTANSKIKKYSFTATASQTAFSVASNAGDELQVFLNGVLLKETDDYTYTTSTVTLGTGATVSDIVEVHVYQSFTIADTVNIAGDTMTGELEVPTVKLSSNIIKASDGGSTLTLDTSDNVAIAGNVKVGGNIIQASDGGNTLTLDTSDNLTVAGNIQVGGNIIKASDGGTTITLDTSDNVAITGDLTVTGGDIKSSGGTTAISVSGANTTLAGTANNIGTATGTFSGTVSTTATLNLYEHFKPVENFGHDGGNSVVTLTLTSNKRYLILVEMQKTDGVYFYHRAGTVTCASDGATSIANFDTAYDTSAITVTTGSSANEITVQSGNSNYRMNGMLFLLN